MKTYKLSIQLKTSSKDPKQAFKEVKEFWERTKKYDHSKVSISTSVADIVNDPDYEIDPHVHEFVFLSDDKAELQKMADDFNRLHYPNFKKNDPDSLGVRVTKNIQGVREESSKKIKAQESTGDPGEEMLDIDQVAFESLQEIIDILMAGGAVYYALSTISEPNENERKKFYQTCYEFFNKIVNDEDYIANNGDDDLIRDFKKALKGLKQ